MKATGIVRRIEACVIIGQTAQNPHKHWVFADFCPTQFAYNYTFRHIHNKGLFFYSPLCCAIKTYFCIRSEILHCAF